MTPSQQRVFLTGATGYVGGRLLTRLLAQGHPVTCFSRNPDALNRKVQGYEGVELCRGSVEDFDRLARAMKGSKVAYYLVHSMGRSDCFVEADRKAARNFARAACVAGVKKIVYVGGLGDPKKRLSSHLSSRMEVGKILRSSGIPVIEFRASIVIGSGSLSFELVRALVDRLPVMIMPKWVQVKAQPIFINDLLAYLLEALRYQPKTSQVFEIGGADIVSYRDIMKEYAKQMGLSRVMIDVPVLTPYLSSLWLGLVTPVFARVGRKLVESLKHPTYVRDDRAMRVFNVRPVGLSVAVRKAIHNEDLEIAETHWNDALSSSGPQKSWAGTKFKRRIVDSRSVIADCTPQEAFRSVSALGGKRGWLYANWLWQVRGTIDWILGGVGVRRGRSHPDLVRVGDYVDWWRVERVLNNQRVVLRAEMKVPGRAWLDFEIKSVGPGKTRITQTAIFDPAGVGGLVYWYSLYPIHVVIFKGMLQEIGKGSAEEKSIGGAYSPVRQSTL